MKTVELQPVQIANGANELLGEVSASKITGEEERYSHIDLVDFEANVEGSEAAFEAVKPLLDESDPELSGEIEADFKAVFNSLEPYRTDERVRLLHRADEGGYSEAGAGNRCAGGEAESGSGGYCRKTNRDEGAWPAGPVSDIGLSLAGESSISSPPAGELPRLARPWPSAGKRADDLLRELGYASWRAGQREAVVAALEGRDSLIVMPTGGGKSLCYQLPGLAYVRS